MSGFLRALGDMDEATPRQSVAVLAFLVFVLVCAAFGGGS
jgi:hypothetical protein